MILWFNKYSSIIRASIITALEYKASSIVGLFAILTGIFTEYLIWDLVYEYAPIEGWPFQRLMAYIFLALMIGQLKSSWVSSHDMIMQIRHGHMNQYLIKPISFFSYNLVNFIGMNTIYMIPYSILILIFPFVLPGYIFGTIVHIPFFIFSVIISIYLSYSIYFFMICFSFWFGEVRALITAYNIANLVLAGQIIPLDFFPDFYQKFINFTPIPFLVHVPVNIAMHPANELSTLPIMEWMSLILIALCWCFIMTGIGAMIYSIGIRRYEAYGS